MKVSQADSEGQKSYMHDNRKSSQRRVKFRDTEKIDISDQHKSRTYMSFSENEDDALLPRIQRPVEITTTRPRLVRRPILQELSVETRQRPSLELPGASIEHGGI